MGEVQQELLPGKDELKQTVADIAYKHRPGIDPIRCGELLFSCKCSSELRVHLTTLAGTECDMRPLADALWSYRDELVATNTASGSDGL